MKVKAKFKCDSVLNYEHAQQVEMSPVHSNDGENADFFKATPWGNLKIGIDKSTPAFGSFVPGKSYYLTLEEAE